MVTSKSVSTIIAASLAILVLPLAGCTKEKPTVALHEAVIQGNQQQVELHIANKADLNAWDDRGRTPLVMAAFNGHVEIARLLLRRGANVNGKSQAGCTALQAAAKQEGNPELVTMLLKAGAQVDATDEDGFAALHFAAGHGRLEVVECLLENGADVNLRTSNNFGTTALILAVLQGHSAVVRSLLEHGADIALRDNDGETAREYARVKGLRDIVLLLDEWGRSEGHMTTSGRSPTAPLKASEITGMFGLKLGDELPTQLVRKLDGWREWAEAGVYSVTPPQPSEVFDSYMVHLLGGPIYKIQASNNGRGQALVHIYDDAKKQLISQFGPPTSSDTVDDRGDKGMAWEQNLRYGGRVRMTLAMRKDSNAGYVVPGMVMLEIQKLQ